MNVGEEICDVCKHERKHHWCSEGKCYEYRSSMIGDSVVVRCPCQKFTSPKSDSEQLVSPNGGKRQRLNLRFDKLPGGFTSLVWIARVNAYGALKYELENWKKLDPHSEQSPLNHSIGHALEACELEYGSLERIWALAKAAWNLLAQIWFEMEHRKKQLEGSAIEDCVEEWFEKKCAPTTYTPTTYKG